MKFNNESHSLLRNLITDVQSISILWQAAVLLASLGLAWLLQDRIRRRAAVPAGGSVPNSSTSDMGRLLLPLFALVAVIPGRWVLNHWYPTHLLNITIPLLFTLALIRAVIYVLHRIFSNRERLYPWERLVGWLMWFWFALYVTNLMPQTLTLLDSISFNVGSRRFSILLIGQEILVFTISVLVTVWLASSFGTRVMKAEALGINQRVIVSKISRTVLILVGVLIALPLVGVDITALSVFGGALGIGTGLGLQKIASNYVSGFIILLDRSLHIGDIVTVDGRKGEVTSLANGYVVLRSADGTDALIPNDTFITSTVISQTFSDRRLRLTLPFQISYTNSVEVAMNIMLAAAKKQERILTNPEPVVFLNAFADSGINLELLVWVENPVDEARQLRSDLNIEIWSEFQKNGIEIPYPQREVRLLPQLEKPG